MTPVVPRIGNNVSHVTRISSDSHFAWQAQYSVMFFLAGAVFGEIWNDSRSAKCCIFQYKTQIFQSTLVLFDPKKIEVFFSKKLEVFSLKK